MRGFADPLDPLGQVVPVGCFEPTGGAKPEDVLSLKVSSQRIGLVTEERLVFFVGIPLRKWQKVAEELHWQSFREVQSHLQLR